MIRVEASKMSSRVLPYVAIIGNQQVMVSSWSNVSICLLYLL
jgi:hypothetical protein